MSFDDSLHSGDEAGPGGARGRHPIASVVTWLLVVFLVLFPKGGIKVGAVPLTWGYGLVGVTAGPLIALRLIRYRLRFRITILLAVGSLLPFLVLLAYGIRQNGINGVGSILSDLTGFVVLPVLFLLVYPSYLPLIDREFFSRCFRFCILAAAIWGIFLFFWRPIFGFLIEIPLLTVNLGDYGEIESTKHIVRGSFLKLISTYNNGNVYGVATLILYPLYMLLERKPWKRNVLRVALILTLSRTVWIGLVIEQLLSLMGLLRDLATTFPRVRLGTTTKRLVAIAGTLGLVGVGLLFSVRSLGFLFDSSLGGRGVQLQNFVNPTILPGAPVGGFAEIVYVSALQMFGVSGMLAMLLIFLFPAVLIGLFPGLVQRPTSRAAAKGLALYAILAAADGAINLIPVLAFYWFAYMVFLCGLPGERAALPFTVRRVAATRPPRSEDVLPSAVSAT